MIDHFYQDDGEVVGWELLWHCHQNVGVAKTVVLPPASVGLSSSVMNPSRKSLPLAWMTRRTSCGLCCRSLANRTKSIPQAKQRRFWHAIYLPLLFKGESFLWGFGEKRSESDRDKYYIYIYIHTLHSQLHHFTTRTLLPETCFIHWFHFVMGYKMGLRTYIYIFSFFFW